jgi:TPR repeat protein
MKRIFLTALLSAFTTTVYSLDIAETMSLAEQGFAPAQYNLGIAYDKGDGVPQDHSEAVKWYGKAAIQGHARAQNNLAASFGRGEGVEQNNLQAIAWYQVAANQGDALAQSNLATMYSSD